MSEPVVEFDDVTFAVANNTILEQVTFALHKGEHVAVIGGSGSGKSTLLAAAMGFVIVDTGKVRVNCHVLSESSVTTIRNSIGFVHQEPVIDGESVKEGLTEPFSFKNNHNKTCPTHEELLMLLDEFGLPPEIFERSPKALSGGEKQRLALIRARILGHKVFLVDEISSALDTVSKERVYRFLAREDHTLLAVTHDMAFLKQCHRVFRMENGWLEEAEKEAVFEEINAG